MEAEGRVPGPPLPPPSPGGGGGSGADPDPPAGVPGAARGPLLAAEVLALDDELMGSVGLPALAARPPDHVAFSPGVRTEFGFPGDAAHPRSS